MDTERSNDICQVVIVGNHHSSVAVGAEVLGWKKREATKGTEGSGVSSLKLQPNGLRRVFYYGNTTIRGDLKNRIHLGALPK